MLISKRDLLGVSPFTEGDLLWGRGGMPAKSVLTKHEKREKGVFADAKKGEK